MRKNSETIFAGLLTLGCAAIFHAGYPAIAIVIVSIFLIERCAELDHVCGDHRQHSPAKDDGK